MNLLRVYNILFLLSIITVVKSVEWDPFEDGYLDREAYDFLTEKNFLERLGDYVKSNKETNPVKCIKDILKWTESLNKKWALKMFDSCGKPQAGILVYNFLSLGQFDECLSINEKDLDIKGKYCFATLPFDKLQKLKTSKMYDLFDINTPMNRGIDENGNPAGLMNAVCIPHSCSAKQVEIIIYQIMKRTLNINETAILLSDSSCSTTERPEFTSTTIAAIVFFSLYAGIIVMSTTYDLISKFYDDQHRHHNVLASFSLYTNTERLIKSNKSSGNLQCLNGIRVLSMFWVIMGHRYSTDIGFPLTNYILILDWSQTLGSMMLIGATVSVDTFFVLSGLLLAYIFFKQTDKTKSFSLPLFYFHRFLRLWPAMAALLFFNITIYTYMVNGPFWPILETALRKPCEEYWWSTLLYLQNYVNPLKFCLGHLWYLCVDTQLYVISPILLYPLLKNEKFGIANLTFWTLASQITVTVIVYTHEWLGGMLGIAADQDTYQTHYYMATHMRATPWLLGFAAGFALYKTQHIWQAKRCQMTRSKRMNTLVTLGWLVCFIILGAVVFGIKTIADMKHQANDLQDGTFNAFARTAWSFCIIWIVFSCIFGYGGPINWILSFRIWEILGRLAYSMYLLHPLVQILLKSSRRGHDDFIQIQLVHAFFGDLVMTILVSYLWVMAFESPYMVLEKALFSEKKPKTYVADFETSKSLDNLERSNVTITNIDKY